MGRRYRSSRLLFVIMVAGLVAPGCSALDVELGDLFAKGEPLSEPAAAAGPAFTVELRESGKPAEELHLPLEKATFVQDALERSGATKRFRRMNIQLVRVLPQHGRHHKLDIRFDRASRRVAPAYDYALHPADRLIITEDTSTVLDDVLESLSGPVGRAVGN